MDILLGLSPTYQECPSERVNPKRGSDSRQALAICQELGNTAWLADDLSWLGLTAWHTGDPRRATQLLESSFRLFSESGDDSHMAMVLRNLGMIARSQGDYAHAAEHFRASVDHGRAIGHGDDYDVARGLCHLARAEALGGQYERAMLHFQQALQAMRAVGLAGHSLADCLDWLAAAKAYLGQATQAASLYGAADAQWHASGAVRYGPERATYAAELAGVRAQLSTDAFNSAWSQGYAMNRHQALAYALEQTTTDEITS